jgi:hypothetical protein
MGNRILAHGGRWEDATERLILFAAAVRLVVPPDRSKGLQEASKNHILSCVCPPWSR